MKLEILKLRLAGYFVHQKKSVSGLPILLIQKSVYTGLLGIVTHLFSKHKLENTCAKISVIYEASSTQLGYIEVLYFTQNEQCVRDINRIFAKYEINEIVV